MAELIIRYLELTKFRSDYEKLKDFQKELVDEYLSLIKQQKPIPYGDHKELREFHESIEHIRVYEVDVPNSRKNISKMKDGVNYSSGMNRLVYETRLNFNNTLDIIITNCGNHRYLDYNYNLDKYYDDKDEEVRDKKWPGNPKEVLKLENK